MTKTLPWSRTRRVSAIGGAAAALTLIASSVAYAQILPGPGDIPIALSTFTATVDPTGVAAGATTTHTFVVTNTPLPGSLLPIGGADIAIPAGFTSVSVGVPHASNGHAWIAYVSHNAVHLRDASGVLPLGTLGPGQSVRVAVTETAPSTLRIYPWTTKVDVFKNGVLDLGLSLIRGFQPTIQVADQLTTCAPHNDCYVMVNSDSTSIHIDASVASTTDVLALTLGDPGAMSCRVDGTTAAYTVSHRSTEATYTITSTSSLDTVCYASSATSAPPAAVPLY